MSFSSTTSSPPASSIHSDSEGSYVLVPQVKVLKSVVNGPIANSVQSSLGLENASEEELMARINSLKTENEDLKEVLQKNNNVLQVCCRYIFNFNLSFMLFLVAYLGHTVGATLQPKQNGTEFDKRVTYL